MVINNQYWRKTRWQLLQFHSHPSHLTVACCLHILLPVASMSRYPVIPNHAFVHNLVYTWNYISSCEPGSSLLKGPECTEMKSHVLFTLSNYIYCSLVLSPPLLRMASKPVYKDDAIIVSEPI
jgi:hypothetical protein